MNIEQLRGVIERNMALDPNDDFGTEKCWEEMTAILSEDIVATLHYFENECTDEEFYWLGAVFEDVAEKTQSKKLIQVLRNRLTKVTPETYCQQNLKNEHMRKWVDYTEYVRGLSVDIDFAEGKIDE
jgi:hypothetical protein